MFRRNLGNGRDKHKWWLKTVAVESTCAKLLPLLCWLVPGIAIHSHPLIMALDKEGGMKFEGKEME